MAGAGKRRSFQTGNRNALARVSFFTMRLLLLLVLLLRLAPDPSAIGAAVEHCRGATVGAAHHEAAHQHSHQKRDAQSRGECSHCPPADCSRQVHCAEGGVTMALASAARTPRTEDARDARRVDAQRALSIEHTPPTRPPATLLA